MSARAIFFFLLIIVLVRNRAKEIVELLSSTDKIRSERKLAKKNRNKYIGVGSDSGPSSRSLGFSSTSTVGSGGGSVASRFAGFGSGAYGNNGGGISFNGDALSYGELVGYPAPTTSSTGKYDDEDDGLYHSDSNQTSPSKNTKENLFGSDDEGDDFGSSSDNKKNTNFGDDDDWGDFACGEVQEPATNKNNALLDDDFSDFQHAVADEPTTASKKQDLFDLLGDDTTTNSSPHHQFGDFESQPIAPSGYQQQQQAQSSLVDDNATHTPTNTASTPTGMWAQASNFVSLDSLGKKANDNTRSTGPSMNALKSSSVQADWNNWASSNQQAQPSKPKTSAFDDLLF